MHRFAGGARILAGLLLGLACAVPATGAPEIAEAGAPTARAAKPGDCGLVREFDEFLDERDAYPVDVLTVDSSPQQLRDNVFPLPPGPHSFELVERIPQDKLSPGVQRSLDESIHRRAITIDVQANTVYVVGAKLLLEHWHDPDAYWAPVIYQERGKRCEAGP